MKKVVSNIMGFILATLTCVILIYAYETERSFLQIIFAFILLLLPLIFISSLKGKVPVFIFTSFLLIAGYICLKNNWFDTVFGIALAIILGGAIHTFRISKTKAFSSNDYKDIKKK